MAMSHLRSRLAAATATAAAGALLMLPSLTTAAAAAGSSPTAAQAASTVQVHIKQVHIKQASLDRHRADCPGGASSAHIILKSIKSAKAVRPSRISVVLSDSSTVTVLSTDRGHHRQTARYDVPLTAGQLVTDAVASVPARWKGEFALSHYECTSVTTSPTTTTVTSTTTEPTTTTTTTTTAATTTVPTVTT